MTRTRRSDGASLTAARLRLGRPRRRIGRRAQATIEFAFCFPLYLLVFFGSVDAALWSIQNGASVTAAEQAARLAAAVEVGNCNPPSPCVINPAATETTPLAADITTSVRSNLQAALFGTTVRPWCQPTGPIPISQLNGTNCLQVGAFATCPKTPDDVRTKFGDRVIVICVETNPPAGAGIFSGAPLPDPPSVTAKVIGYLASLVPPAYGLGWHAGEIPIDIGARTHTQRFTT